ncbi:hypothetical protein [Pseudonocardia humida]|uniref:Uncharacterized protein n=1 Tax=Pseudonocardia humida TaxID=2800819 RepID=A0ABT1AD72_9PSEU|nr:hypothetical protein [Pseudonocardia humida]MCO1660911.1 hypothetical protein [Pseudonocardia humida]
MGDYDEPATAGSASGRWRTALVVVAALAVGLVAGYLLRGGTEPAQPVAAPSSTAPAPSPTTAAAPSPCVEIAEGGSDLVAQLEQAAQAIGALDPTALRAVLDEVQRLRTELEADAASCRAQAEGSVAAPTPSG